VLAAGEAATVALGRAGAAVVGADVGLLLDEPLLQASAITAAIALAAANTIWSLPIPVTQSSPLLLFRIVLLIYVRRPLLDAPKRP